MFFSSIDKQLKSKIKSEIESLAPWYQPIDFGHGIKTHPKDKHGRKISHRDLDRGIKKWNKFIKPSLPFDLVGKKVLDCGCNAGLFLIQSCKEGAKQAYGIEVDDHYFKQARFVPEKFSEIEGENYPIEIFNSSFEEFDYESLGEVDLTFFLNTIYHIGRATHGDSSPEKILEVQSDMIRRIGNISKYILFQANSLEDQGRGKGRESLYQIIEKAGLKVAKENDFNHPRGLIVVASK